MKCKIKYVVWERRRCGSKCQPQELFICIKFEKAKSCLHLSVKIETIIVYELDSIKKKNQKHEMHTQVNKILLDAISQQFGRFCHLSALEVILQINSIVIHSFLIISNKSLSFYF